MPAFDLTFRTSLDDASVSMVLEALDEDSARKAASHAIAEALGRSEALVLLDPNGRFTAGAGFWSRRGVYSLVKQRAPASTRLQR